MATGAPLDRQNGAPVAGDEPPLLVYDGDCGLCARSVRFVLRHEGRRRTLRFATLQGPLGATIRARYLETVGVDSVIWYERTGNAARVRLRSDAVLRVLAYLGGGWRVLGWLGRVVPRAILDRAYDAVARNRRRFMGDTACLVPTDEQRRRFAELNPAESQRWLSGDGQR